MRRSSPWHALLTSGPRALEVTEESFQLRVEAPRCGVTPSQSSIPWLAVEVGTYTLDSGQLMQATRRALALAINYSGTEYLLFKLPGTDTAALKHVGWTNLAIKTRCATVFSAF